VPLPRPTQAEEEESFLTRCMSDKVMIEEFPKLEQRFAVCKIQWDATEDAEEEDKEEEDEEDALIKFVQKVSKATNFPTAGDDETISLQNSKYELFPLDFAERVREKYPKVWGLGGNVLGNEQYKHLYTIRNDDIATDALTPRQVEAIRLREAWSARHSEDFRIAGVVAQIKWHMVGDKGVEYMKKLVNEEIEKRYGGGE
jgi:hypothetical protein